MTLQVPRCTLVAAWIAVGCASIGVAGCKSIDDAVLREKPDAARATDDGGAAGRAPPAGTAAPTPTGGMGGMPPAGSGGTDSVAGTEAGNGTGGTSSVGCVPNPDTDDEVCTQICPEVCNDEDEDCDRHVDEDTDTQCDLAHASATCAGGACVVVDCADTWRDCDGDPANGCEVADDDPLHCGTCAHVCAIAHATATCDGGVCVVDTCAAGWADCDADPTDCETPTNTANDCGACDAKCEHPARATATCASGTCLVDACIGNWGDCNGDVADGCEVELNTLTDCGKCDTTCALGGGVDDCSVGVCKVVGCDVGYAQCDGNPGNGCEALDTGRDCGTCHTACAPGALDHVASASCATQDCEVTCAGGWGDCDGTPGNGCETALDSVQHCAACGIPCVIQNAIGTCAGGSCQFARCADGWGNCNGNLLDGCERKLDSAPYCGSCTTSCTSPAPVCSGGVCSGVVCPAGKADCDQDGFPCEVTLTDDVDHCGACGNTCDFDVAPGDAHATLDCMGGACTPACEAGFDDCDGDYRTGCETALDTVTDCGACGVGCAIANATATCAAGECEVGTCDPDWGDCDMDGSNCETPLDTITDCGACGDGCTLDDAFAACGGTPGARACEIVQCVDAFHEDCDGDDATGCEVDTRTDTAHCGACDHDCAAEPHVVAAQCDDSACVFDTCEDDWADCDAGPGCETPIDTVQDCGGCGNDCDLALANTQTTSCNPVTLTCEVATCDANFGNCDGMHATGCERPTDTLTDCRACDNECTASDPNAYPICGAAGCTIGCNGGLTPCGDACVDIATSTLHCKGCGNTCMVTDPNGYAVCGAAGCELACNGALTPCSGACVDTNTSTQHCKGCGNACPGVANGAPVCGASGCTFACNAGFTPLNGECPTFGGAYAQERTDACPAGYTCYTGNPYTGGCSCPAGFTAIGPFHGLDDRGWSQGTCPVGASPFGWTSTWVCRQGTYSSASDFAGAYKRSGAGCLVANPYTGGCSCPSPAANVKTIEMRVDTGCWTDEFIGLCWNNAAPRINFGGAYQRSDYSGYGSGGCLVGNPATGACSCPAGTSAIAIRTIWGPDTGCSAAGAYGAHIYICRE